MRAGYGRGYYGEGQLAPRRSSGRGWFKVVAVVGVGAVVVWLLWPRSKAPVALGLHEPPPAPPPAPALPLTPTVGNESLDQIARSRGFSSTKEYEDAVLEDARELRAAGAKVELGPQLQHLEPRLLTS